MKRRAVMPPRAVAAMLLGSALVAGCIVVPQTREVYDPDCRIMRREVTLESSAIGHFAHCIGRECAALLAAMGLVSAASLVVSGSIAIVGNAVYWFEHEANCRRADAPRS